MKVNQIIPAVHAYISRKLGKTNQYTNWTYIEGSIIFNEFKPVTSEQARIIKKHTEQMKKDIERRRAEEKDNV